MSEINVKEKLEAIVARAMDSIDRAGDLNALNDVRVSVLGKKGELTAVLKGMKDVAPEDRPKVGQMVNDARSEIENRMEQVKQSLEAAKLEQQLKEEVIDVTLPARKAEG